MSDYIFEIHQLWQSGFSRVYSNWYCRCSFKPEITKIGQSSQKMYSNNIVNSQESTTILNSCTKKVWKLIEYTTYIYIYIYDTSIGNWKNNYIYNVFIFISAQSEGSLEYIDCISAEGWETHDECPGYDIKQSDLKPPVLKIRGMWSTSSLLLLPSPLLIGVVTPDRVICEGQIEQTV